MAIIDRRLMPCPDADSKLRGVLVNYWNAIANCEEMGGLSGDLVRETEVRVTELLNTGNPFDLQLASRITARFECERARHS